MSKGRDNLWRTYRRSQSEKMLKIVTLVSLLFLEWTWIVCGAPVLQDSLITTQENFNLEQFLGKWFEVAVVSTCPHFMQRKKGNPVIVAVELQPSASEDHITATATTFRNESCKKTSTNYSLTETPGRFFYHVARFGADVDAFVAGTNYVEYAMMVLLGTEQPSGIKTTTVKLHSRTKDVSATISEDFKKLVRQQGINDEAIIINQDKGHCEQMTELTVQS